MFSGFKIIELASVLAGPSVGQFFAELGAEVIKVENVKTGGDVTRSWRSVGEKTDSRSAYFCSVNWGKKSIHLDLKDEADLEELYGLVKTADIIIASYKPGDAEKLRVDYEELRKYNAAIIYGKITGFGEDVDRVGYDAIIQAEYGFMSMNGDPGGEPLKMPVALMDILAAHQLKEALLLGLIHKMKTGEGSLVQVSLAHTAVASLANQATNYLVAGQIPERKGSAHPNIAPYGEIYYSADNTPFVLAIGSDKQFSELCQILNSDLHQKSAFATNQMRVNNREALKGELNLLFASTAYNKLEEGLLQRNIPFGRIRNIMEVAETPAAKDLLINDEGIRGFRTNAFSLSFYTPFYPTAPPKLPEF